MEEDFLPEFVHNLARAFGPFAKKAVPTQIAVSTDIPKKLEESTVDLMVVLVVSLTLSAELR